MSHLLKQFNHYFKSLRIEELIGLMFILPTAGLRLGSILYFPQSDAVHSISMEEDMWWIGLISLLTVGFFVVLGISPENKSFKAFRNFAPYLFVMAIFANIQIFIFWVNPHDIHFALVEIEAWLFGLQPTVWMERFTHPILTDWLAFSYMSYYWFTLVLLVMLYINDQSKAFRTTMLAMIISSYLGFLGYIIFPAASPYLVIPDLYSVDIWQGTSSISETVQGIVKLSPERTRDAFPSMHNAITLITMIMAWRYKRILFWMFLPLAISLPIATLYLRYHFAVDIFAGVGVAFLGLYISPLLESWWTGVQDDQESHVKEAKSLKVEA